MLSLLTPKIAVGQNTHYKTPKLQDCKLSNMHCNEMHIFLDISSHETHLNETWLLIHAIAYSSKGCSWQQLVFKWRMGVQIYFKLKFYVALSFGILEHNKFPRETKLKSCTTDLS